MSLFLFFALGIGGYLIYFSSRVNTLVATQDSLQTQIKSQETTEQKMVLLKDRINKIDTLFKTPSITDNIDKIDLLIKDLPEDSVLSELSLDVKKTDMSILFTNSKSLGDYLTNLKTKAVFKTASLTSFTFNPTAGYTLGLRFTQD